MLRVFILIVLFGLLFIICKRLLTKMNAASKADKTKANNECIVQCSQCGLYVPESESKLQNQLIYCNNPNCLPPENKDGNKQ